MARFIDADALKRNLRSNEGAKILGHSVVRLFQLDELIDGQPSVEVVHGYNEGDVCFYGFHDANKSLALVEIVKILNDERGVAEVSFLKVFVDDTGNGMFDYLLRSGNTMNVSIKYLRNITPNFGAKMDGGDADA